MAHVGYDEVSDADHRGEVVFSFRSRRRATLQGQTQINSSICVPTDMGRSIAAPLHDLAEGANFPSALFSPPHPTRNRLIRSEVFHLFRTRERNRLRCSCSLIAEAKPDPVRIREMIGESKSIYAGRLGFGLLG